VRKSYPNNLLKFVIALVFVKNYMLHLQRRKITTVPELIF